MFTPQLLLVEFRRGFVVGFSDDHVVIESLTPRGECNGWILCAFSDIFRIDCNGRYEEKLLSLYRVRDARHPRDFLGAVDLTSDLKVDLLQAARLHDYAVEVETGGDDNIVGFVREIGTETLSVEKLDLYGQNDGDCTAALDEIERIIVNDGDLQDLKLLARWHDTPPL